MRASGNTRRVARASSLVVSSPHLYCFYYSAIQSSSPAVPPFREPIIAWRMRPNLLNRAHVPAKLSYAPNLNRVDTRVQCWVDFTSLNITNLRHGSRLKEAGKVEVILYIQEN